MAYIRKWWIGVAAIWLCMAVFARGQDLQPFGPVPPGDLSDVQLFAPPDLSTYGNFPRANTGPWFEYQRLYLAIHQPSLALIGNPSPVAAGLSDANNQFISGGYDWGNRYDLGYMSDESNGWETSIIKTNDQISNLSLSQTRVGLIETSSGLPVFLQVGNDIFYKNITRLTGFDLMKVHRYAQDDNWGTWELSYGARVFQVHDRFDANEGNFDFVLPGDIAASWDLGIDNNLVGPQVGARWTNTRGRWTFIADAKFMPAANFENASLYGSIIDTNAPPLPLTSFNAKQNSVEFAPMGEVRFETSFKVTDLISLKVGYNALAMTGIGRASRRLDYTYPNMGIVDGAKNDHLFANGLSFGFEINR